MANQKTRLSAREVVAGKTGTEKRKAMRPIRSESEEGPTYRDGTAAAIHEGLSGLAALGALDPAKVSKFEKTALTALPHFTGEQVRELRLREMATQTVFAKHLGVSVNTVSQWERGERKATGTAAKLLSLVDRYGLAHIV